MSTSTEKLSPGLPQLAGDDDVVLRERDKRHLIMICVGLAIFVPALMRPGSEWYPLSVLLFVAYVLCVFVIYKQIRYGARHPWLRVANGRLEYYGVKAGQRRSVRLDEVTSLHLYHNKEFLSPHYALEVRTADDCFDLDFPLEARPVLTAVRALLIRHAGARFTDAI